MKTPKSTRHHPDRLRVALEAILNLPTSCAVAPVPSQKSPEPLRVALEYAASTLENEYRSDPTLQDLARSLRAALGLKEETGNGGH